MPFVAAIDVADEVEGDSSPFPSSISTPNKTISLEKGDVSSSGGEDQCTQATFDARARVAIVTETVN